MNSRRGSGCPAQIREHQKQVQTPSFVDTPPPHCHSHPLHDPGRHVGRVPAAQLTGAVRKQQKQAEVKQQAAEAEAAALAAT